MRYRLIFLGTSHIGKERQEYVYTVCTSQGIYFAVVLATGAHNRKHPEDEIDRIVSVEKLDGKLQDSDIVHYQEWR